MPASPAVESLPPEPIAQTATPAAGRRGRAPARPAPSALLPGLGHLLRGEWRVGMTLLLSWGFLLALSFLSRTRLAAMGEMRRVPVDLYVAVAGLARLLLAVWAWALCD